MVKLLCRGWDWRLCFFSLLGREWLAKDTWWSYRILGESVNWRVHFMPSVFDLCLVVLALLNFGRHYNLPRESINRRLDLTDGGVSVLARLRDKWWSDRLLRDRINLTLGIFYACVCVCTAPLMCKNCIFLIGFSPDVTLSSTRDSSSPPLFVFPCFCPN